MRTLLSILVLFALVVLPSSTAAQFFPKGEVFCTFAAGSNQLSIDGDAGRTCGAKTQGTPVVITDAAGPADCGDIPNAAGAGVASLYVQWDDSLGTGGEWKCISGTQGNLSGHTIEHQEAPQPQRSALNFGGEFTVGDGPGDKNTIGLQPGFDTDGSPGDIQVQNFAGNGHASIAPGAEGQVLTTIGAAWQAADATGFGHHISENGVPVPDRGILDFNGNDFVLLDSPSATGVQLDPRHDTAGNPGDIQLQDGIAAGHDSLAPGVEDDVVSVEGGVWVSKALDTGVSRAFWRINTSQVCGVNAPSSGRWNVDDDSSQFASTTKICIHDVTDGGLDISPLFEDLASGANLLVQLKDDSGESIIFKVTGEPIDQTTYWEIPVSRTLLVGTGWTWSNNSEQAFQVPFGSGGGGGAGTVFASAWRINTSQACGVDTPASGRWNIDDSFPYTSAVRLCLSDTNDDGLDLSNVLDSILSGNEIYIQLDSDSGEAVAFNATGPAIDQTTYWEVPVEWVASVGSGWNNNTKQVFIFPGGTGGRGDFVGPSSSTDNSPVIFSGSTGKLGKSTSGLDFPGSGNINTSGNFTMLNGGQVSLVEIGGGDSMTLGGSSGMTSSRVCLLTADAKIPEECLEQNATIRRIVDVTIKPEGCAYCGASLGNAQFPDPGTGVDPTDDSAIFTAAVQYSCDINDGRGYVYVPGGEYRFRTNFGMTIHGVDCPNGVEVFGDGFQSVMRYGNVTGAGAYTLTTCQRFNTTPSGNEICQHPAHLVESISQANPAVVTLTDTGEGTGNMHLLWPGDEIDFWGVDGVPGEYDQLNEGRWSVTPVTVGGVHTITAVDEADPLVVTFSANHGLSEPFQIEINGTGLAHLDGRSFLGGLIGVGLDQVKLFSLDGANRGTSATGTAQAYVVNQFEIDDLNSSAFASGAVVDGRWNLVTDAAFRAVVHDLAWIDDNNATSGDGNHCGGADESHAIGVFLMGGAFLEMYNNYFMGHCDEIIDGFGGVDIHDNVFDTAPGSDHTDGTVFQMHQCDNCKFRHNEIRNGLMGSLIGLEPFASWERVRGCYVGYNYVTSGETAGTPRMGRFFRAAGRLHGVYKQCLLENNKLFVEFDPTDSDNIGIEIEGGLFDENDTAPSDYDIQFINNDLVGEVVITGDHGRVKFDNNIFHYPNASVSSSTAFALQADDITLTNNTMLGDWQRACIQLNTIKRGPDLPGALTNVTTLNVTIDNNDLRCNFITNSSHYGIFSGAALSGSLHPGTLTGGTTLTLSNFTVPVTDGEFELTLDGITQDITAIDFTGDVTEADVAATIEAAIQAEVGSLPVDTPELGYSQAQVEWTGTEYKIWSGNQTGVPSTVAVLAAVGGGGGTDISGANFLDMTGAGIVLDGTLEPGRVVITNNRYMSPDSIQAAGGNSRRGFISLQAPHTGVNISHNTVTTDDCSQLSLNATIEIFGSYYPLISYNETRRSQHAVELHPSNNGYPLIGARIFGNLFEMCNTETGIDASDGVRLNGVQSARITNNIFCDSAVAGNGAVNERDVGGSPETESYDNAVNDNSSFGQYCRGAGGVFLVGDGAEAECNAGSSSGHAGESDCLDNKVGVP